MFEHVTVLTPRSSFTMDAATLIRLAEETRRRLETAFPGALLLLHDDGSTIWAGVQTLPPGWVGSPETVYWPAVRATRAAVLAVVGDGRVALGHDGRCTTLPPPLL